MRLYAPIRRVVKKQNNTHGEIRMQDTWTKVEQYTGEYVIQADGALGRALQTSAAAGLPEIQVPPGLGKLLHLLARSINARSILEVGTLGGYSAIWLARALVEGGKLTTLERDPHHAQVARDNIAHAGLTNRVEVVEGAALETLAKLAESHPQPFDLVFIDADKENNPEYFAWGVKLTRPGGLIIVDNVVRDGDVVDAESGDERVQGVRRLNDLIRSEPKVAATTIQTVSSKGYDGFTLALVVG